MTSITERVIRSASILFLGTAACGPINSPQTPDVSSTVNPQITEVTPPPTLTQEFTPTFEPFTPESPKLIETIEIDIPGLTVEKYQVRFHEITEKIPESYRSSLEDWVKQPEFYQGHLKRWTGQTGFTFGTLPQQCGPSFIGVDIIRTKVFNEFIYYNGDENRFYGDLMLYAPGLYRGLWIGEEDQGILNWQAKTPGLTEERERNAFIPQAIVYSQSTDISCDGKILYNASDYPKNTIIIADIPNGMKTVIRDSELKFIESQLSDDGNRLLLSFPGDKGPARGTYLIDLKNWHVQFHLDESAYTSFLNENGSLLYLLPETSRTYTGTGRVGYIYDVVSGEKTSVVWPSFLTPYEHVASRNLHFIARTLGMFSSDETVEGQWGIIVYTPEGLFMINSPEKSLWPWKIDNEGTIYAGRGDIFKFVDGTYHLAETGDGKPIELQITKLSK